MKKLVTGMLVLTALMGCVLVVFSASQAETLVSRSYLSGIFWSDLRATVKQEVDRDTSAFYTEAAAQAEQVRGSSGSFAAQTGVSGDMVTGSVGSGLIWTSGNGVVRSGTLVDATVGSEVAVGGALSVGHRYLAGTDVTLMVASGAAQWMAEGKWSTAAGDPTRLPFTDVDQNAWYHDDVVYVYRNGLFNGESPTAFEPGNKMQRCMMTTVLHRLAGKPAVSYSSMFRDIPNGQWYTEGTIWAGSLGVVTGVEAGRFDPFSNVTRQEIAVILYRYAGQMGYDTSVTAALSGFGDVGSVASWGNQAMSWAVGAGILNGSDGLLQPNGDATRAEVAAMLHRFASWSERQ